MLHQLYSTLPRDENQCEGQSQREEASLFVSRHNNDSVGAPVLLPRREAGGSRSWGSSAGVPTVDQLGMLAHGPWPESATEQLLGLRPVASSCMSIAVL